MTRSLQVLGLAFATLIATIAIVAPPAEATNATFSWPTTTKHLTASADPTAPAQKLNITAGKFGFECNVATAEGLTTSTGSELIEARNITFSHTEKAADTCRGPLNSNAPIKMNECTFTFEAGTTLKEAPSGETEGTVDIVCPAEKEITIEAPGCITHIPTQVGLGPVFYRTTKTGAKEEVTVEAKVNLAASEHKKGIKYSHTGFVCSTGSGEDGTFEGKATVKGYSADKVTQTDVTLAPPAEATNATFSWPTTTKHLTASADPTASVQKLSITAGKFAFECNVFTAKVPVVGTGAESVVAENLTFSHTAKEADTCNGPLGSSPTFKMNECTFTFEAGTTLKEAPSGETEGTVDIVCPAGKEITIEAVGCITHIPTQVGLGPVFYRTTKTGAKEEVTVEAKVNLAASEHKKGIKYSHTGFVCSTGSGEDGTFEGKATVKGYSADKVTQTDVTLAPPAEATNATFSWPTTTKHLTASADPTAPAQKLSITAGKFAFECNVFTAKVPVVGTGAESVVAENITFSHTAKEADTCNGPLGSSPTFKMNECTFTFEAGTTLKEAPSGETEGTVDIVCPAEKEITIEAPGCITHIPTQVGLGPVFYRTTKTGAKEEVTVEAKVNLAASEHKKGVKYSHTGFVCSTGSGEDGTFEGKTTVKGYSANKVTQTDVTVT